MNKEIFFFFFFFFFFLTEMSSGRVFVAGQQEVVLTLANASLEEAKCALRAFTSLVCTLRPPLSLTLDGLSLLKPPVLLLVERVLASVVVSSFTLSNVSVPSPEALSHLRAVLSNLLQQPDLCKVCFADIKSEVEKAMVAWFVQVASLVEELAFNNVPFLTTAVVKQCLAQGIKRLDLIKCPTVVLQDALSDEYRDLGALGLQNVPLGGRMHSLVLPPNVRHLDLSNTGLSSVTDAESVASFKLEFLSLAFNPEFNVQLFCSTLDPGTCCLRTLSLKGIQLSRADVAALTSMLLFYCFWNLSCYFIPFSFLFLCFLFS